MSFIPLYNIAKFQNNKEAPKIAEVIYTNDPKNQDRIKVKLKGMFDPIDDIGSNLPWIRRMQDSKDIGLCSRNKLSVGDKVELIWPYDETHVFYRGLICSEVNYISGYEEYDWGWIMPSGFIFLVNKSNGNCLLKNSSSEISLNDSELSIKSNKNITINSSNVTINGGNVDIESITTIEGRSFLNHVHTNGNEGNNTGPVV